MNLGDYAARCIVYVLGSGDAVIRTPVQRLALDLQSTVRRAGLDWGTTRVCVEVDWDTADISHDFYAGGWTDPDEHEYSFTVDYFMWDADDGTKTKAGKIGLTLGYSLRLSDILQGVLDASPAHVEQLIDRVMTYGEQVEIVTEWG